MNPTTKETEPYLASFARFEKNGWNKNPPWVRSIRKEGISRFAERGFPTLRDEDWRFTSVAPIAKLPFNPVSPYFPGSLTLKSIKRFTFGELKCNRMVFVNGHYADDLSSVYSRADGVKMGSLAAAMTGEAAVVERHLARYAQCDTNGFSALNTAFFGDGAFILIPPGKIVEEPIHLLFISSSCETGATAHPRNLIIAEKESKAMIIERYVSLTDTPCFTNAVTEMVLGEGAALEYCKFQDEDVNSFHMATLQAQLGQNSHFLGHSISTGARLARSNINAVLDGSGIECVLNGLYLAKGEQHVDHHMVVDHAKPRCNSHEYYHGILDERSKGVFHGRILVRKDAQKTDAKQTNKNLLLSDEATIDTKPQLEIYADDVKCTHGATIGRLDEEAIFYLKSRGIGQQAARRMLIQAFANDVINRISIKMVRQELEWLLVRWLAGKESAYVG